MSRSEDLQSVVGKTSFRQALLRWFDEYRRDLPWRQAEEAYAVWVSEIMLQQTQVATVIDYYERWMERFPSVYELADAEIDEVLELWSGLGYYRRARYLHSGAQRVVDEFDGRLPSTVSELKKLPGIGPYTAGAIASIAFGAVEPLVDGNVERVISRLFALSGDPKRGSTRGQIWARAEELVDPDRPGDFNQALMELGSLVCALRSPSCQSCPTRQWCLARKIGKAEAFPESAKRAKPLPMRARACVVYAEVGDQRRFLLRRRPAKGLLARLWEFPSCERAGKTWPTLLELKERLAEAPGVKVEGPIGRTMGTVEHVFSHRRLRLRVHQLELPPSAADEPMSDDRWRWVDEEALADVASAALLKKVRKLWAGS